MVNLLLISCNRELAYARNPLSQTHLDGNIVTLLIRPVLRLAVIHVHLDTASSRQFI